MSLKNCLKCKAQYEEPDVEAYYCSTCLTEKQGIAAEIDAKFANRPKEHHLSDLQKYDLLKAQKGFVRFKDL